MRDKSLAGSNQHGRSRCGRRMASSRATSSARIISAVPFFLGAKPTVPARRKDQTALQRKLVPPGGLKKFPQPCDQCCHISKGIGSPCLFATPEVFSITSGTVLSPSNTTSPQTISIPLSSWQKVLFLFILSFILSFTFLFPLQISSNQRCANAPTIWIMLLNP